MNKIDLSKDFSIDVLDTIASCATKAFKDGYRVLNIYIFCVYLCEDLDVIDFLKSLRIDFSKLKKAAKEKNKTQTYPFRIPAGTIIFSPDFKMLLLKADQLYKLKNFENINKKVLALALLGFPMMKEVLSTAGVDQSFLEELSGFHSSVKSEKNSGFLAKFCTDITIREDLLESRVLIGRNTEISQLLRVLVRGERNNAILLGENGTGRRSIVFMLAQRIRDGRISQMGDVKIYELNILSLVSALASRDIGNFIEFLAKEMQEMGNCIFFIKNLDIPLSQSSYDKTFALQLLRNMLSMRQARFIITMNNLSYKSFLALEPGAADYFDIIKVEEPPWDVLEKIIENYIETFSTKNDLKMNKADAIGVIELSQKFIHDIQLPAKAINLIEEAGTKVILEGKDRVDMEDVQSIVSEKTGIPIVKLSTTEKEKLLKIEDELNSVVIGQSEAVHAIAEVIRRSRAGLKDPKRPIGSFLFLGSSGIGKTYLAKNLAKIMYDSEKAMITLDMSEFSEPHTVQRLIGSPPGYVGYGEGGQLTNPVWERPYCLILLDEIEKAHPKVFDIFLQILDEGRLTDGQGRTVDFKNTIIIATSNISSEDILTFYSQHNASVSDQEKEDFFENQIMPVLKMYFRPEFINRFDDIIIFNPLSIDQLKSIARIQIKKVQERLKDKKILVNISDEKLNQIAEKSYNPTFGARQLIRSIQENIENVIASKIISGEITEGETVNL